MSADSSAGTVKVRPGVGATRVLCSCESSRPPRPRHCSQASTLASSADKSAGVKNPTFYYGPFAAIPVQEIGLLALPLAYALLKARAHCKLQPAVMIANLVSSSALQRVSEHEWAEAGTESGMSH